MKCALCGFPLPDDSEYFEAMRTHLEDVHDVVGWRNQKDHIEGDQAVASRILV